MLEQIENFPQLLPDRDRIDTRWLQPRSQALAIGNVVVQLVACAANRKALLVKQFADAADQQHFMMLVIPPVATALHWFELRKLLLPVAKYMRLHTT